MLCPDGCEHVVIPHSCVSETDNGAIHKVIQTESQIFYIAEYHPFNHRAHISSIILHPTSVSNTALPTLPPPIRTTQQ